MIQFNLLPDVKLEYIKARRSKRLVMLAAAIVTAIALTVVILLCMVVYVFQRQHSKNLSADIAKDTKTIRETPDIEKILTVQSQLISLPDLHNKKPVVSRLPQFLQQVTPTTVSISSLDLNFADGTMRLEGSAEDAVSINRFVDTLKFTDYKAGGIQEKAFSEVVLGSINTGDNSRYSINLKFKTVIFDSANQVELIIPNIITTRSQLEKPGASPLFGPTKPAGGN